MDKDMLKGFMEVAKANLQRDDSLTPVALGIKDEQLIPIALTWGDEDSLRLAIFEAGATMRLMGVYEAVLLIDAALRVVPEEHIKYFKENLDTEAPLCYPEGLIRKECIVMYYLDFKTGGHTVTTQVYKRVEGKVQYEDSVDLSTGTGQDIFTTYLLKGYTMADAAIKEQEL